MPLVKTTRNDDDGTLKQTLRINDEWSASLYHDPNDERKCSFVVEALTERFVLDIYVSDRERATDAFNKLFDTLQEIQIGDQNVYRESNHPLPQDL